MRARPRLITLGLVLGLLATVAPPALAAPGQSGAHARLYYVSVGTSLSVGIQPDASGENQRTDVGYADQLYALLKPTTPKLRLVKLGCPGETSVTMIHGGICTYDEGSQLAQAVAFLHAHREFVTLVTIDIGANDLANCADEVSGAIDLPCVFQAFDDIATNLPQILTALREAAGPDVPIVAMNYYNPFLALWFLDPALAFASADLLATLNTFVLGPLYGSFVVPVGDVAAAFQSDNFDPFPGVGLPVNVVLICQWTWMCVPPPVGPNIHANAAGYAVIAQVLFAVLPGP